MEAQSLSVCVPAGCPNRCKFCVSRMHDNTYPNLICPNQQFQEIDEYISRLEFARDNGVNTVILTGVGEPMMNMYFLNWFGRINRNLSSPFKWIELQTSGINIDEHTISELKQIGVKTISLSISNIFSSVENILINDIPTKYQFQIDDLCCMIKKNNFNLRLSLNMTYAYNQEHPKNIFEKAKELGANQITFRKLYGNGTDCEQDKWIRDFSTSDETFDFIQEYICENGIKLHKLSFGAIKYSIDEISTVIDFDCMSKEFKDSLKYMILRPNCKLYSQWDDKGSLIF